jgi:hypothetical protein
MSRGIQRCRLDGNHVAIMDALRKAGMKPLSLANVGNGCPDLAIGFRGLTLLLECKDGSLAPSRKALTADEKEFFATWPGHVAIVESPEQAVTAVIDEAKRRGVL